MTTQLITQPNNQGRGPHSEMASTLHWLFGNRSISTADIATEHQLITNGDENEIATSSLVTNEASSEVLSEALSEALPSQDTTLLMEYATNYSIATTNFTLATNNAIATNGALATGSDNQLFTNLDNLNNSTDTEDAYYGYDYYFDEAMADANDRRIYARFYMLSVILPIGLFFNTFAFLVFLWSPNIRRTTTGRFLIALTIADNTFIFGDFLRWLNTYDREGQILGIEFAEVNLFGCASIYFLRFYGQLASGWLTVAITIERFIVVAFPLKAGRISTVKTAIATICLINVASATLTLFPYWTLHIADNGYLKWCEYMDQEVFDIYNWAIIRIASILLPSLIIFLFTGLIIYKLDKISKKRQGMANVPHGGSSRKVLERQLTWMLVAVAVTFLILRVPYVITYYLFDFRYNIWGDDINKWLEYRLWLARDICDVFATANYAINFFLYCLTGSQFRANMFAFLRCESVERIRTRIFTSTFKHSKAMNVNQDLSESTASLCVSKMDTNGSPLPKGLHRLHTIDRGIHRV